MLITSKNQAKIAAVIPFFNEEKHLSNVIHEVLKYVDCIIIVNDGSTDDSVNKIPINDKIYLLHHSENLGKGEALNTGLRKSIELNTNITITLDADNQHDPDYIPKFLDKLNNYDCVIGNRERDKTMMPIHRKLSNYLTSKLLSIKTGVQILDSQSGYRAFKTSILNNILPNYSGFEAESEMIVKICENNYSLGFQKIPTIYGDDESKMKAIPTILGFIKVLVKT